MKAKIYSVSLLVACIGLLSSCKSKESAYQKVYEAAQARSTVPASATQQPVQTSWTAAPQQSNLLPASENGNFLSESLTAIDGGNMGQYGVVIGSFTNKTNATSLKERMQAKGYSPMIAQNAAGMYRVIVASFDNKTAASQERNLLKDTFPEFSDAWLLERVY
ncbi:cell division protein [Bacteroidia bacterium]|nr:cell division protein [Bacteroidia bacterium]